MSAQRNDQRIAVIGIGSMGSMSAWALSERGYQVVGFEQFGIPHDRGAHGAETRIYRQAYKEGAEYLPVLVRAGQRWDELTRWSGLPVFTSNGCLYISDGATPWLEQTEASATAAGIPTRSMTDTEIASEYPQHRLFGGERGLLDLRGGTLRPELAVTAAAARARSLGADLREYAGHTTVEPLDSGRVRVHSDSDPGGDFDAAVITTGAWTDETAVDLGFGVRAKRLPATWYAADDPGTFGPERFPVCIRSAGEKEYSGFPCVDGWTVKVMPPVFRDTYTIADQADRDIRPEDTAFTRAIVRDLLIGLRPNPVRTGVYLDGFLDDGERPLIDVSSVAGNVIGAVGFSGHGFKMSPAIGDAVTRLVDTSLGHQPADIELGDLQYFTTSGRKDAVT